MALLLVALRPFMSRGYGAVRAFQVTARAIHHVSSACRRGRGLCGAAVGGAWNTLRCVLRTREKPRKVTWPAPPPGYFSPSGYGRYCTQLHHWFPAPYASPTPCRCSQRWNGTSSFAGDGGERSRNMAGAGREGKGREGRALGYTRPEAKRRLSSVRDLQYNKDRETIIQDGVVNESSSMEKQ